MFIIMAVFLYFSSNMVLAVPIQDESFELFSLDSESTLNGSMTGEAKLNKSDSDFSNAFDIDKSFAESGDNLKSGSNNTLLIPDAVNSDVSENQLQNLQNTFSFEDKEKRDRREFYSSQNKEQGQKPVVNLFDEKQSGLSLLLETMDNAPQMKEKALNTLDSIKDVKEFLTVNSEITYENSEQASEHLIRQNMEQQKQQMMFEQRGVKNTVSKEKYDSSMFREFISRVLNFTFYAVAGIIFIKLMFSFVSWQRKVNKF